MKLKVDPLNKKTKVGKNENRLVDWTVTTGTTVKGPVSLTQVRQGSFLLHYIYSKTILPSCFRSGERMTYSYTKTRTIFGRHWYSIPPIDSHFGLLRLGFLPFCLRRVRLPQLTLELDRCGFRSD